MQQSSTPDNLRASLTDANGNATSFAYDGFDRLATTTYPGGTTEAFTYDADGNPLTRKTRANATIAFAYDTLNRLITKTPPSPAAVVSYRYDLNSRLTGAGDTSATITAAAPPAPNTLYATSYSYDSLNRPLGAVWTPAATAASPGAGAAVTFGHAYNKVNQRTGQSVSDNTWLSYPAATPGTTSYTANALNQYSAVGAVTPAYDANGNLTSDGTFTFGYDAENRLAGASGAGNTAAYAFDAQNRRKSKTVNGTTTISVTDADNREVLEYDGATGQIQRWYAYGLGSNEVLNQMNVAAANRATYLTDLQGSVVATLDSGTGALTKFGYLPYGKSAGAPAQFGYTGQRVDPETNGLYYYRARHYSPVLGRFLQPDPIGYSAGVNFYAYVGNDPLNNADPSGLQQIPPDAMAHILNAHGIDTPRTRPGNSVFSQEYSDPSTLQQLSNDVFASPLAPPGVAPFGQGNVMVLQGQVLLQNQSTGQTVPYPIGTDANGVPTNQVQIYYDKATGNVMTMFPVPITGSQGPQSFNGNSGSAFIPASTSTSSGNLTGSDQNSFIPTVAGTASGSPSSSTK